MKPGLVRKTCTD